MAGILNRFLSIVFILGVLLLSQMVFAQEKTSQTQPIQQTKQTQQTGQTEQEQQKEKKEQKSPFNLDEITVAEKRAGEPVTSPYAVPESSKLQTEVWTKEEIEALHPQTVWDVLEQVPGMEVTFQGRQHMDFSNMRGTGNYGLILDGVYVTSLDRILATLPVDAIESMTVVRDATALTLGPLANFGSGHGSSNQGFIVIKTKRAAKLEGGLVAGYGSFNTVKGHLYHGAKIGKFDYRVAGTYNSTDGKTDWYNGSRNNSVLLRGGFTTEAFSADLIYYTSRGMREFQRGEILKPTGNNWSRVGTLDTAMWKIDPMNSDMIAIKLSRPWTDAQTTTFQYAYNRLQVKSVTTNFPEGSRPVSYSDQDSYGQSVSLRHVMNYRNNTLKLGGQFLQYVSPTGLAPSTGKRVDENMYGVSVCDEYRMFNDKLVIDAGIRVDKKHYANSPVTGRHEDEWAKETYTGSLGFSFKPIAIFTFTGRYAYSENAPAGNFQISPDGSALPPERRSRFEAGLLANIHAIFNPWITGYYYDTDNQKVGATGVDPNTGAAVSSYIDPLTGEEIDFVAASNVITKGAEVGVSGYIFKPVTYRVQYTYVTTNDESTNDSIAHHLVSAGIGFKYKNAFANISYRYVGAHDRSSSPAGVIYYELGNYSRLDANAGYNFKIFSRDTRITLYGKNLGDSHYATRYVTGAYKDPGIQYGAELAVSFF